MSDVMAAYKTKYPGLTRETSEAEEAEILRRKEAIENPKVPIADLISAFECGPRLAMASLENYATKGRDQIEVLANAKQYAATLVERLERAEGALFYGPPGTGKDHLAVGIARAAMTLHRWPCRWVYGLDFYGELRAAIGSGKDERDVLRQYEAPKLLVLSDPVPPLTDADRNKGELTAYQVEMLARLVEHRNRARKLTITTINCRDGKEASARLGAATWSRLRDHAWVFPCFWNDFRQPAFVVGKDQ